MEKIYFVCILMIGFIMHLFSCTRISTGSKTMENSDIFKVQTTVMTYDNDENSKIEEYVIHNFQIDNLKNLLEKTDISDLELINLGIYPVTQEIINDGEHINK